MAVRAEQDCIGAIDAQEARSEHRRKKVRLAKFRDRVHVFLKNNETDHNKSTSNQEC